MAISYSKEFGGGQKVFISTVNEMSKLDCKISVILPDRSLIPYFINSNVEIFVLNYDNPLSFFKILNILKSKNFSVINTYLTKASLYISFVNLFIGRFIYCTLLNAIIHEKLSFIQKKIYPIGYFLLSKMCDGFIVNSRQNKTHFIDSLNLNDNFIKVIYSGIDVEQFARYYIKPSNYTNKKKITIGYVGRLSPEKGSIYLIEALSYLDDIEFECKILGDGPIRNELENLILKYKLSHKVEFFGFQENIADYIYEMDVIVVPSLNETFGLNIVEGFALKKAVIATNIGGIPEIISDGISGYLVPPRDSFSISEKIRFLSKNFEIIDRIGQFAFGVFRRKFTSTIMAKNTLDYLKQKAILER